MSTETIWEFNVPLEEDIKIEMPANAEILCVDAKGHDVTLWARVNPLAIKEVRRFAIYSTGWTMPKRPMKFIGMVNMDNGEIIIHVFEIVGDNAIMPEYDR